LEKLRPSRTMNYSIINKTIHDYIFRIHPKGAHLLLAFDEYAINEIVKILGCTEKELLVSLSSKLNRDWSDLLQEEKDTVPSYFGLLALQSYAAFLMHNDEEFTENAYIKRFETLLGNKSRSQQLFRGISNDKLYLQDKIWKSAKEYILSKGYLSNLPEPKERAGRNVQYPKSQALLNMEDLRSITAFFKNINLQSEGNFSINSFISLLESYDLRGGDYLTIRAKKLFEEEMNRSSLFAQIFNFYQLWDGAVYLKDRELLKEVETYPLILFWEEQELIYGEQDPINVDLKNVFTQLGDIGFESHYRKLLIFKTIPQYPNDFQLTRFIEVGQEVVFIVDKNLQPRVFGYISERGEKLAFGNHVAIRFIIKERDLDGLLERYIKAYPIKLKHGLRLGRKNVWLEGAGPIVSFTEEVKEAWVNEEKRKVVNNTIAFTDMPISEYIIKIRNHTNVKFKIVRPTFSATPVLVESTEKWTLPKWNFEKGDDISLHGLVVNFSKTKNKHPIRYWITDQLSRDVNGKSKRISKLHKQIKHAKNSSNRSSRTRAKRR